jgi:transposase
MRCLICRRVSIQVQIMLIQGLQKNIDKNYKRLTSWVKQNQQLLALRAELEIGSLTSNAFAARAIDLSNFESYRLFTAWLPLIPCQSRTGGKNRYLVYRKYNYDRTNLMNGARVVTVRSLRSSLAECMMQRKIL